MPRIADYIDRNKDLIVQRYLEEAGRLDSARGLKPFEIIDTLPEYLQTLSVTSRQGHLGDPVVTKQRLEETHIGTRLRLGYTQEEVTAEYVLMGRIITSLWEGHAAREQPSPEDIQLLLQELDGAMEQVVTVFTGYAVEDRQREKRTLRQLQALAPEVLVPQDDLHARLGPLVDFLQRTLKASRAALYLVRPGEQVLVPVAPGNAAAPVPLDGPESSFLARVVRAEEPLLLATGAGPAATGLDDTQGLGTVMGLRLWPHGKLLGLCWVGFTETRPVAPQDKRLFETLVEYLSGILDRALLFGQLQAGHARLSASEARYRLASQTATDAIWDWELDTGTLTWSPGIQALCGFTPEELGPTLDGWRQRLHPDDRDRVVASVDAAIAGSQLRWQDEYRFRRRDGGHARVLSAGIVERDAHGRAVRMVGSLRDVTAPREEEAGQARLLQEARTAWTTADTALTRLQALLFQAPVAIAILRGPTHVVELANPRVCQLWRRTAAQVLGRPVLEALPEVWGQGIQELLDGVFTTGTPYVGTEVHVRLARAGDGPLEDAYFDLVYQPLRQDSGHIEGVFVVATDVTETVRSRQRAEALNRALREEEERLRLALDAAALGSWDVDPRSGAATWDARARTLLGLPPEGPVNFRDALEHIHLEDRERMRLAAREALTPGGGGRYTHEYRVVTGDARERWVSAQGQVHFGPEGAPVRFLGTVLDVTGRKRAEAVAHQRAEFEKHLVGIVSHDLRNPLSAILLGTSTLLHREALDERSTRAALRIQSSAERALRMIRDLLDFTQARVGGGIPVHRKPVDLTALTRQVVEEVQMNFPERDMRTVVGGAEVHGTWDPDRIAQVLTNLVSNAAKYSPEGTPITVRLQGSEDTAVLEVHNGGAPIPEDLMPRLFQPMQRGGPGMDQATRSVGLGLYIVRHIVDAHGGTIDVHSTQEHGTTFTVRLPI